MADIDFGSGPGTGDTVRQALDKLQARIDLLASGGGGNPVVSPVFTTPPSISPTSGQVGATFTAYDGIASNATGYTRRWLLDGTSIGTGTTVVPVVAGTLILEVTADNVAGMATANSDPVTVTAASATALTLTGPLTYQAGAAFGTLVANIGNVPTNTTPTLTPNDGRLAVTGNEVDGWKVTVGATASSAGSIALTVSANNRDPASANVNVTATSTGPVYRIVALLGQSNMAGRGQFSSTLDTNQANVKQYPSVVSGTTTYRTIRDSIYPLYHPEGQDTGQIGPGQTIGKAIAATLPANEIVLLVPCAWGGTSLVNPNPNSAPNPPQWAVGRPMYETALAQVNAAIAAAKAINPASSYYGAGWVQGESDNSQDPATYENALRAHITDWRSRVTGGANTPYIIGSMLPEKFFISAGHAAIDARQRAIAANMQGVSYVPGPYGRDIGDGTHFNSGGNRTEGTDMGRSMTGVALVNFQTVTQTAAETNTGFTQINYTVYRTNGVGALTVPITFGAGTTTPADFDGGVNPALAATWAEGANETTVSVRVKGDVDIESDETYTLTLAPVSPVVVGSRPTVTGTIVDDDSGTPTNPTTPPTPVDLPAASGLYAYFDTSDRATLYQDTVGGAPVTATGQTVGAIADKSGNGRNATAVGTPVLGAIGSKDAVTLNGTNQQYSIPDISKMMATESEFTIHAVFYANEEANTARSIWSSGSGNTSRRTLQIDSGAGQLRYAARSTGGVLDQPLFGTTLRAAVSVVSLRRRIDGTVIVKQNGTEIFNGVVTPQAQSVTAFQWGARRNQGTIDNYFNGQIGSLAAFSVFQADADFDADHAFLRTKWS